MRSACRIALQLVWRSLRGLGHRSPDLIYLSCLVMLSGTLGEPMPDIARIIAMCALIAASLFAMGRRWKAGAIRDCAPYLLLIIVGAVGAFTLMGAALLFASVWVVGMMGLDRHAANLDTRARCVVMVGVIGTVLTAAPGLWNAVNLASVWLTTTLFSWAGGGGLGASASGLSLLIVVSPLLISAAIRSQQGHRVIFPLAGIGLFVAHAAAASIGGLVPEVRFAVELSYAALLISICVLAISLGDGVPPLPRRRRVWAMASGLVMVAGLAWTLVALPVIAPGRDCDESRHVLFVDHTLLGSWSTPSDAAPGNAFTGATFGQFLEYVEAGGHRTSLTDEITDDVLSDVDLVVVINPGEPFAAHEKENLFSFVRAGGGLLVLGDHTNIGGIMDTVNDLTLPLGFSLAFDSAASEDPGWSRTIRMLSPFSAQVQAVEIPVSIGASVCTTLHPMVCPILVGRRAYSDPGDPENTGRALLGNLEFDRGERYGDLVLAAVRHLGRGKAVLFGDTSSFQNSALALSHQFTDMLVRWLTDKTGSWRAPGSSLAALVLVVVGAAALRRSRVSMAGAIALAAAIGIMGGHMIPISSVTTEAPVGRIGVIDSAHGNLVRFEPLHDGGVEGLGIGLARAGFLPFIYLETPFESLPSPQSAILSIAPTRGYSSREAESLLEWLSQGGRLIISTGWPQSIAMDEFLLPLGVRVSAIPLGSIRPDVASLEVAPQLPSAWPLEISSEWVVLGSVGWDGTEYVVIAERAIGLGSIIVVGDHGVFLNANLEGKGFAFMENLDLLAELMLRTRGGEDPS